MKTKTMKKMLSFFLAVLMIALAIPFTLLTVGAEDGLIKSASITLTSGITNDASERAYGSIAGMIDGDVDGPDGERYYQSKHINADDKYYSLVNGKFVRDTSSKQDYYGYATFELISEVALESMTIWLAGDNEQQWKKPENNWGINNAYDIFYSSDGETWTAVEGASFEGMCGVKNGDGTFSLGAGFPQKGSYGYHELTHHNYVHVGHRIALNGIEAKYIAIAISGLDHSGSPTVVIGDVTVEEKAQEPAQPIQPIQPVQPDSYADFADGGLIYKVNFNGTANFWSPTQSWSGMDATASDDGNSVALTPTYSEAAYVTFTEASVWGAELPAESDKNADGKFRMLQSAYTVVFTLNAEDEAQEMGLFLDWATGFAITPGMDSFRYVKGKQAETVFTGTYEGTKALTQTYAIEIKDEGTATNINDHTTFSYNCTVYNLYVVQNGEWVKIFSLEDSTENAQKLKDALNWGSGDWEFVLRMFRDGFDGNQRNAMTISDMSVYKGLAIAEHNLAPEIPEIEAPEDEEDNSGDNGGENGSGTPDQNSGNNSDNNTPQNKDTEDNITTDPGTTDTDGEKKWMWPAVAICGVALLAASTTGIIFIVRGKKKKD